MISWRLKGFGCRPIGLDIGHHSVKMVQLTVNGEHINVLAADKVRVDPDINGDASERRAFVVSAIKRMLGGGGFHGRSVISCIPNDRLKITNLRLAEAESGEVDHILRKEAAKRFGLDAERDAINYVHAGSAREGDEIKNEFILFATDNGTIKDHIEMLEEAGLRPVGIDTVPFALFRSFERSLRRQEDKERTVVFVDVGSGFTTVVFGRGGEISFVKQIPIGGERFNREVAAKLGVSVDEAQMLRGKLRIEKSGSDFLARGVAESSSDAEEVAESSEQSDTAQDSESERCELDSSARQVMVDAIGSVAEELVREISLCFRYYTVTFRGKRVERAVLAGGEAYEGILLDSLRRQLAVEVEVAQPLRGCDMKNVDFGDCKRGLLCEWAVAVGLGLKGLNPEL